MKNNHGLLFTALFISLSIFSYFIFRKIGKRMIKKHLKELQKNDSVSFNDDEIGKDKFFLRKYFVKNDRDKTIREFDNALGDKPKLLNRPIDCEDEISKYI